MAVTNVDPATIATRWATNLAGSGAKVTAGVQAVTVAPGQAAARQKAQYVAGVQAAATRWARNVAAVPLATWQDMMTSKGIPRMGTGAQKAKTKFAAVIAKIMSTERTIVGSLPPRGSTQANIQRAVQFMTQMAAAKGSFTA